MADLLDQLYAAPVEVEVILPNGAKHTVLMGSLTLQEWDDLGEAVPSPEAPYVDRNARGEEIRNYQSPTYQKEFRAAESERRWRRLAMALIRGGNVIDGLTFDDQVKRVKANLDGAIAMQLMRWQSDLILAGKASVVERSKRFQPGGDPEAAGAAAAANGSAALVAADGDTAD